MEKELSFEENLAKLESIVKDLENGDVLLDDAINKFNEAMTISKLCDEKLKKAEESVSKIINQNNQEEDFSIIE